MILLLLLVAYVVDFLLKFLLSIMFSKRGRSSWAFILSCHSCRRGLGQEGWLSIFVFCQ